MSRNSDFGEPPKQLPSNSLTKRIAETAMVERLYATDENDEREMTLRDHWQILRNHAWVIISTVVVVTLLATVWFALRPDYYEGHARVEIDLEGTTLQPNETESHFSAADLDPAYFATQLQIIRSPMVLEQVVKALDLQHDAIYKRHMAVGGRKLQQLLRLAFLAKKDPLIEQEPEGPLVAAALNPAVSPEELKKSKELEPFVRDLQERLTVEPVKELSSALKDTRLVSIIVRHPSPVLAAKLANAISDAVVYSNRARKLQAGKTTNTYLAGRIDGLRSKIQEDELSLAKYASKHNILSLDPSQNTAIERLTALNRQLVEAENTRKEAEANYQEAFGSTAADTRGDNRPKQVSAEQARVISLSASPAAGKPSSAAEASDVQVLGVRSSSQVGYCQVFLDLSGDVRYKVGHLGNPERLYLDLFGTGISPEWTSRRIILKDGLVDQIRMDAGQSSVTRLVVDLHLAVRYRISTLINPPRMLIELIRPPDEVGLVESIPMGADVREASGQFAGTRGPNSLPRSTGTAGDPERKLQVAAENVGKKDSEKSTTPTAPGAGNGDQGPRLTAASALAEQNEKQIADLESKLAELRQKRAQLMVGATEKWPEVEEVDEQIASVENSLARMRGRATSVLITNLETKYRQELAHEAAIRKSLESQRRVTQVQNQDAVEYRLLQQQIEAEKNLLNEYLKRFDSNDVQQAAISSNIRAVDYATLPGWAQAAGPWRLLYVALAFIVSLLLSLCLALFLESWDDTLRSSDEVKQVMRLPALAVIPAAQNVTLHRLLQATGLGRNGRSASPASLLNSRVSPDLLDNYRRLRTAVRSLMPESSKVMVVTSALSGEGKTTTTVNLAISLAQMHAPVLLIDGDSHQQRLSEVFRMGSFAGLQELLATPNELDEKEVLSTIQKHEATGVYVLPAGRHVPSSAELLDSAQMRTLLRILRSRFSYILIDSPAVTACVDSIILSKIADRMLMVVESGRSSREILRHTQATLIDAGANLMGVVLSKVKVAPRSYN
jgi:capsular exopolysaccharide synthesis family protein